MSAFLLRSLGTLMGFAISLIIARLIGAEGSGIYYLAVSVATVSATIGQFGFENTVVRFVASHAVTNEWNEVRAVYRIAITVVALASMLVAVIILAGAHWISINLFGKPMMEVPLMLMAFAVMPFSLSTIHAEALRGLKKIIEFQIVRSILIPLGSLVLLYPFVRLWHANGALVAYLVSTMITAIAARMLWLYGFEKKISEELSSKSTTTIRSLFQSSWPLFGVTMTGIVIQQVATIMLGMLGSTEDVGVFNVASRVSGLLLFPLMAMISILAPKFAALYRHGSQNELVQLVRRSSAMLTLFAVPTVIVMFVLAEQIMMVFGEAFVAGVWPLRCLLLGVLINVSTGAVGELLIMTGQVKLARNLSALSAFIIMLLCIVLIPLYGGVGAAIAVTTGYTLFNLLMVVMVKRYLGFWPVGFW